MSAKSIVESPITWVIGWVTLVCAYLLSAQQGVMLKEWDYILFTLQLVFDIGIGVLGFLAYNLREDKVDKRFFLLIFLSCVPGLFANEISNAATYVLSLSKSRYINLGWVLGYTLFLATQLMAWVYLFRRKISYYYLSNKRWLTIYPFILSAFVIFLSIALIVFIRNGSSLVFNGFRIFNSMLEVVLFTVVALCLSRTKDKALIYLETGFLLFVAFKFAHRFSELVGLYNKAFNLAWFIGVIIILFGFKLAIQDRKGKIRFYPENTLHVLTTGTFVLFANFILIIFAIISFGLSMLQFGMSSYEILLLNVPSALVFSYLLTALLAKYFSSKLSHPLDKIVHRIDMFAENKELLLDEDVFQVDEVYKLEKFILKIISDLQHANQAKSQFLMNMSHDFRTPASGIQYMSRVIHDRMSDPDLKRLQKLVVKSSDQLMVLLEEVLDFSRIENDKMELNRQYFDIVNLINELIETLSAKVEEKGLTLSSINLDKPLLYYSDKTIIKRVFLNLLSNAIKFTHSGGISIALSPEIHNGCEWIVVRVKDTGIGIDKENSAQIFEPFYRVAPAETAKYPGIGLGLSNVKAMLKKIGGAIEVVSELGVGSEFIVFLSTRR